MEQETRNKKQETRKSTLLLSLILLFFVQIVFSQNANSFFVEGNKLYQQEKYLEAIEQYIQIEKLDKNSFAVYYNLANAYYKINKVAPAIYYYEKALQIEPNNKDVLVNLGFAKRMTMDNIEELPTTALQKISKNTIQKLSFNSWAYLAVFLSFLFATLFLVYHFSSSTVKKRLYFITGTLSFVLMLLSVFFAFQTYSISQNKQEAIIFAQQTDVKNAPTLSSETVFKLHEGTKISILETKDNWKKIKIIDGQTGWIIGSELKEL